MGHISHLRHISQQKLSSILFFSFLKSNGLTILLMKYINSVNQYVVDRSMRGDTTTLSSTLARSDHYNNHKS